MTVVAVRKEPDARHKAGEFAQAGKLRIHLLALSGTQVSSHEPHPRMPSLWLPATLRQRTPMLYVYD